MNSNIEHLILCENIRNLRKNNGLSKKEMAKLLGIGIKRLNLLEQNIIPKRLSCSIIIKIYKNFGILPKDIFSKLI